MKNVVFSLVFLLSFVVFTSGCGTTMVPIVTIKAMNENAEEAPFTYKAALDRLVFEVNADDSSNTSQLINYITMYYDSTGGPFPPPPPGGFNPDTLRAVSDGELKFLKSGTYSTISITVTGVEVRKKKRTN